MSGQRRARSRSASMRDPWAELEDDLVQLEALTRHARMMMAELGVTRARPQGPPTRRTWCQAIDAVLSADPQTVAEIATEATRSMDTAGRTRQSLIGHVTNELKRKAAVMGWAKTDEHPMRWYKKHTGGGSRSPF